MPDIVLDVPLPPSVNRTRRVSWAGHAALKRWQGDADKCLMLHQQHKQGSITKPYTVVIEIDYAKLRGDMDNVCKALIDFCVSRALVVDDRKAFLREIRIKFTEDKLPEGCRVTLRALAS